jgi:hypothetical protein
VSFVTRPHGPEDTEERASAMACLSARSWGPTLCVILSYPLDSGLRHHP